MTRCESSSLVGPAFGQKTNNWNDANQDVVISAFICDTLAPFSWKSWTIVVLLLLFAVLFPGGVHFLRLFNPRTLAPDNEWFLDLAKRMIQDRQNTGVSCWLQNVMIVKCHLRSSMQERTRLTEDGKVIWRLKSSKLHNLKSCFDCFRTSGMTTFSWCYFTVARQNREFYLVAKQTLMFLTTKPDKWPTTWNRKPKPRS